MTQDIQDHVSIFQLESSAVRGRAIQLGSALDIAIGENRYPDRISRLLGEAMMIAAIIARALKFDGRLIVQCHGTNDGAISLLMADCTSAGDIRGYARWNKEQLKMLELDHRNPGADVLLGKGTFSMTIDQGPDMDQYQGLATIEGQSLAECAEHYFAQSEQIPTRIKLAVGQSQTPGNTPSWRGGGMMIQRIATDETRSNTENDWQTAEALFDTLSDEELIDPELPHDTLIYRLFHESGVRLENKVSITANCGCSEERLLSTLKSFDKSAIEDMAVDNIITANCEFCGSEYHFDVDAI